jgi:hypothetical protein
MNAGATRSVLRAALALSAAGVTIGALLRLAGVVAPRSPFVLADLRWLLAAQGALLLLTWRFPPPPEEAPPEPAPPLRGYLPAAAAAAAAGFLVYARDLNVFLWDADDWAPMYVNAWVLQGNLAERLGHVIWDGVGGMRPTGFSDILAALIQLGVFSIFGTRAWAYHGFALAVHAACSVLALLLARRLGAGVRAAAAAGLFVALFPPSHEIVTAPSFFNFGLVTFWMLLACLALPGVGVARPWPGRACATAATVLALLTKETAVMMPAIAYLVLAVGEGTGWRSTWKKHKGSLLPIVAAVALYLATAAGFAAFAKPADVVWDMGTTLSFHRGFWGDPVAIFEMLSGILPVSLLTPITEGLFPRTYNLVGGALAAFLALAVWYLGRTPRPRRLFIPLCAAWALTPVVAGPLLRYPVAFSEKTHYYHSASVGLALAFGLFFREENFAPGRSLRRAAVLAAGAAFLAFNVYTLSAIVNVRVWFGGVVARAEHVFTRAYAEIPAGDTVYLVCDADRIDRGGMEPLVFSNAMKNRLDKPIHLVARIEPAGDDGAAAQADAVPFTIESGPRAHIFGWDRARNDFVELGPSDFLGLVSVQPRKGGGAGDMRRVVFRSAEGAWEMRGEVHPDMTPAAILHRM